MSYRNEIDKLLKKAEKIADDKIRLGSYPDHETYVTEWNKMYHDTMDRLAAEAGLRSTRKYKAA